MSKPINWDARDNARLMSLGGRPSSDEAVKLVAAVGLHIFEHLPAQRRPRAKSAMDRVQTIGAILADLFWSAHDGPLRWSRRSQSPKDFSGEAVSYRSYKPVHDALALSGLIDVLPGFYSRPGFVAEAGSFVGTPGADGGTGSGLLARLRATAALLAMADDLGINPANVGHHFRKGVPKDPLELRRSKRSDGSDLQSERRIKFVETERTSHLRADVQEINRFLASTELRNCPTDGFLRIFNNGDRDGFDWNKGGRLYDRDRESFQGTAESERLKILIGGSPVVEIDLRASFLTILYGLRKQPFDPSHDPYLIKWRDGEIIDRSIAKCWVKITLGHTRFHERWGPKQSKELRGMFKRSLNNEFPIKDVQKAVLDRHPILQDYHHSGHTVFDLMYLESEIIMETMLRLIRDAQVPSLPMHDGLIVRVEDFERAEFYLDRAFQRRMGVRPFIKPTCSDGNEPAAKTH